MTPTAKSDVSKHRLSKIFPILCDTYDVGKPYTLKMYPGNSCDVLGYTGGLSIDLINTLNQDRSDFPHLSSDNVAPFFNQRIVNVVDYPVSAALTNQTQDEAATMLLFNTTGYSVSIGMLEFGGVVGCFVLKNRKIVAIHHLPRTDNAESKGEFQVTHVDGNDEDLQSMIIHPYNSYIMVEIKWRKQWQHQKAE